MPRSSSRTSLALANLRGIVILIVLAFHSMLAYLNWIPVTGSGFDSPPYDWRAFPIIDSHRFFGFDLICAWQDVYLMSLMFFLSGLFVWPSLVRKKDWAFLRDRVLRLGLPFAFGIAVVIPVAIYPAYRLTAADPSIAAYWHSLLALPFWPNGPLWFLWQLLALNFIAAGLHFIAPNAIPALGRWSAAADKNLARYFGVLLAASALAYVPLAIAFTPWAWSNSGLFAVQFCRPLLYAVYFFAGVGIGAAGIERGLIAADGILVRRWAYALAAALAALFLWMGLTALTMQRRRFARRRDCRRSQFCAGLRRRLHISDRRVLAFRDRHIRGFSAICRPMPMAFIWCTTSLLSGCNMRFLPRRCSPSSRRDWFSAARYF